MKCADIVKALNGDDGDLKAVRLHLESCPECSRKFARDLEIEEALRKLELEVIPVDITAQVRNSLRLLNKRKSARARVRTWIWITVSVATMALLIMAVPILAVWLSKAYSFANRFDIGQSIGSVISPTQCIHLLYLMVAVLAWMAAYLWREARSTVQ